jgi:hypothetical protein
MTTKASPKSSTPRTRARAAIQSAKKALKEGKAGASARLDKAITAYANSVCKVKSASIGKRKPVKRKATAKRTTKRK